MVIVNGDLVAIYINPETLGHTLTGENDMSKRVKQNTAKGGTLPAGKVNRFRAGMAVEGRKRGKGITRAK